MTRRSGEKNTKIHLDIQPSRKYWSKEEDVILTNSVKTHGSDWMLIAQLIQGRNPSQCAQRWKRIKPVEDERNHKWSKDEDNLVMELAVQLNFNWKEIALQMEHRTGRQIRERYINHLDPNISNKQWTKQEDQQLWKLFKELGTKWSEMSKHLVGRPENMIKNRFYSCVRKKYGKIENPYYLVPKSNIPIKLKVDESEEMIKKQVKNVPIVEPEVIQQEVILPIPQLSWQTSMQYQQQVQPQQYQFLPSQSQICAQQSQMMQYHQMQQQFLQQSNWNFNNIADVKIVQSQCLDEAQHEIKRDGYEDIQYIDQSRYMPFQNYSIQQKAANAELNKFLKDSYMVPQEMDYPKKDNISYFGPFHTSQQVSYRSQEFLTLFSTGREDEPISNVQGGVSFLFSPNVQSLPVQMRSDIQELMRNIDNKCTQSEKVAQ